MQGYVRISVSAKGCSLKNYTFLSVSRQATWPMLILDLEYIWTAIHPYFCPKLKQPLRNTVITFWRSGEKIRLIYHSKVLRKAQTGVVCYSCAISERHSVNLLSCLPEGNVHTSTSQSIKRMNKVSICNPIECSLRTRCSSATVTLSHCNLIPLKKHFPKIEWVAWPHNLHYTVYQIKRGPGGIGYYFSQYVACIVVPIKHPLITT